MKKTDNEETVKRILNAVGGATILLLQIIAQRDFA